MENELKNYKVVMCSELLIGAPVVVNVQAQDDEDAIDKADIESEKVPVLICMDLYREDGSRVKHWGAM
jgi:hypothetical protein